MSNITQFTFLSTTWLQQLVGDVDVTKLASGQAWVPQGNNVKSKKKQPPDSIGYYPGGPPITKTQQQPDQALWSDAADLKAAQTSNLLGYHFNVFGSDKAKSFAGPDGNLLFLFGDIRGQTTAPYDTIAWSDTADPEASPKGLMLKCWTSSNPSFSNQPQNLSDNSKNFTLLVFPNNSAGKADPLDLAWSVDDMGADNAPHSGVTIPPYAGHPDASTYVVLRFNQLIIKRQGKPIGTGWASVLTKLTIPTTIDAADPTISFTYLRVLSQLDFTATKTQGVIQGVAPLAAPTTNPSFVQTALHCYDSSYPSFAGANLADGQGYLLTFGSGTFRGPLFVSHLPEMYITIYDLSSIYLSATPYAGVESGIGTMYFQGHGTQMTWSAPDDQSSPGVRKRCWPVLGGTPDQPAVTGIGDFSVVCLLNKCTEVPELWLIMCDGGGFDGIMLYWSLTPWGPWQSASGLPLFANTNGDGTGTQAVPSGAPFIQDFHKPGNSLNGPVIGAENKPFDHAKDVAPPFKVYGPMMIEKYCKVHTSPGVGGTTVITLTVYWTICTWIPYYAVLMKSEFNLI